MRSIQIWNSALAVGLLATAAWGHPKGFHKKITVTLAPERISALVVMDLDSGKAALNLREPADGDRNGLLEGDEVKTLEERMGKLATALLKVSLSGAPLVFAVKGTRLSLRDDRRASDGPLSVAVLLELEHRPDQVFEGMKLEVSDTSPDASHLVLEVFEPAGVDGGARVHQFDLKSGKKAVVQLGR